MDVPEGPVRLDRPLEELQAPQVKGEDLGAGPLTGYDLQFHRSELPSGVANPATIWLEKYQQRLPPGVNADGTEEETIDTTVFKRFCLAFVLIIAAGNFADIAYKNYKLMPGNFIAELDGVNAPKGTDDPAWRYSPGKGGPLA